MHKQHRPVSLDNTEFLFLDNSVCQQSTEYNDFCVLTPEKFDIRRLCSCLPHSRLPSVIVLREPLVL